MLVKKADAPNRFGAARNIQVVEESSAAAIVASIVESCSASEVVRWRRKNYFFDSSESVSLAVFSAGVGGLIDRSGRSPLTTFSETT